MLVQGSVGVQWQGFWWVAVTYQEQVRAKSTFGEFSV